MTTSKDLLVDGEWLSAYGKPFKSINPANSEVIWEGGSASQSDVGRAVKAAKRAAFRWSTTPFEKRVELVKAYQKALKKASSKLISLISKETGKPLWEAKGEMTAMVAKIDLSIQAYKERSGIKKLKGSHVTRHKAYGAVGILGPFNFPGHLPNGHIVPALLAGNSIVFKPSEETPAVGDLMVRCLEKAGFPGGVINLIQGPGKAGKWLAEHEEIDGLFFTGSYSTGRKLAEHYVKYPEKILALELGGNNPLVVSEVKDLEAAAYLTIQSAYLTAGQRCSCARRLIVPYGEKGDQFIQKLVEMTQSLVIGAPENNPEPFMGPVISTPAAVRLFSKQAAYQAYGGRSLLEIRSIGDQFNLVTPGLMDVTGIKEVEDEEIFGPFLQLIRIKDFDKAIEEANNTKFGLSAGLLSDSSEEWCRFYDRIKAGIINWNHPTTGASSAAPFGGVGCSGNHHPSAYYAADYCAYPVVSAESNKVKLPDLRSPGLSL